MLEATKLKKTFNAHTINEKVALNGVNLRLEDEDFVTVIGGNGAGKSTILNALAGVWPIDEGKIVVDGIDVTPMSEHKRAALFGRVFQDPMTGTAANMQIEENLALALRRGQKRGLKIGITRAEREMYREKLSTLGLGLDEDNALPDIVTALYRRFPTPVHESSSCPAPGCRSHGSIRSFRLCGTDSCV